MSDPDRRRLAESDAAGLATIVGRLDESAPGWVNILPVIDDDIAVPGTPGLFAIFSKRGPVVPLGTWTAPQLTRRGVAVAQIGIQHGRADRAARVLQPTPWTVPEGWRVVSDHPRRGVVIEPAGEASDENVAAWLLGALGELCLPPRSGEVDVFIHDRGST